MVYKTKINRREKLLREGKILKISLSNAMPARSSFHIFVWQCVFSWVDLGCCVIFAFYNYDKK